MSEAQSKETAPMVTSRIVVLQDEIQMQKGLLTGHLHIPKYSIQLQNRQERRLRHFHRTYLAHALLAFLLLFQQFAFAADVAAVAFGGKIGRAHV